MLKKYLNHLRYNCRHPEGPHRRRHHFRYCHPHHLEGPHRLCHRFRYCHFRHPEGPHRRRHNFRHLYQCRPCCLRSSYFLMARAESESRRVWVITQMINQKHDNPPIRT
jgi:hypothetical protein